MNILQNPSPNFGPRRDGKKPYILLLHYTDTQDLAETYTYLKDKERDVSAHYVIDIDGTIHQLVDENMRAHHAGKSFWEGETDINSVSIGIEIQNPGHTYGHRPFPQVQMGAVRELSRDIIARHKILPHHVLGHSDVAPGRKEDPGHLFPWEWLAIEGVGVFPSVRPDAADISDVKPLLQTYGYDLNIDEKELITAFQRHFERDLFKHPQAVGQPTDLTRPLLRKLISLKSKHC